MKTILPTIEALNCRGKSQNEKCFYSKYENEFVIHSLVNWKELNSVWLNSPFLVPLNNGYRDGNWTLNAGKYWSDDQLCQVIF